MRGSVIKRGSRYAVVVEVSRDPATGKRIREWHSGYETRKAAERARTEILHALDNGGHVPRSTLTLGEYLVDEWLPSRKPRQRAVGRGHRGQVGDRPASRLDPARVSTPHTSTRSTTSWRSAAGCGTAPAWRRIRSSVFTRCCTRRSGTRCGAAGSHGTSPTMSRPPRAARVEMPVWAVEELRAFLTHVRKDRLYAAWLLFSTTGMRRGEVCGLAWPDLDLDAGTARVEWTLGDVRGKPTWKSTPKSAAGERVMSLDPATANALRERRYANRRSGTRSARGGWPATPTGAGNTATTSCSPGKTDG
ncbi:MAG: Arm DNA-binding domain-containing protein [Egibacteraceae bacterium]